MTTVNDAYIEHLTGDTVQSGYIYMPILQNESALIETLISNIEAALFPLSLSLLLPVFITNIVL